MRVKLHWVVVAAIVGWFAGCIERGAGFHSVPDARAEPDAGSSVETCPACLSLRADESTLDENGEAVLEAHGAVVGCQKLGDIGRPPDAWLPVPCEIHLDGTVRFFLGSGYSGRTVRTVQVLSSQPITTVRW